eukprot:c28061_g5_i2 orf=259-1077(+)
MPGPGPHLMYTLAVGNGLMGISAGKFTPHHCLVYAINAFIGPDLGSFSEWVASILRFEMLGSKVMAIVHHPLYYPLLLGVPLSLFYRWLSRILLDRGILASWAGVPLSTKQCFYLISAGSLSHFFLDYVYEENGHTSMMVWILSTGWWKGRAPIQPYSVIVVGFLCISLLGGFVYLNRGRSGKPAAAQPGFTTILIGTIATLYCLWCASQIYLMNPPLPAVGEEADLGVLTFFAIFFFLPHALCIVSMHSKELINEYGRLPIVRDPIAHDTE